MLTEELQHVTKQYVSLNDECERTARTLEREQEKRIAAETLAVERSRELDWIRDEVTHLRTQNAQVISERLKSLDALNLKLMEARVEPPSPDFEKMRQERANAEGPNPVQQAAANMINRVRQTHRQMDMAILGALHPHALAFAQGKPVRPTNEMVEPSEKNEMVAPI